MGDNVEILKSGAVFESDNINDFISKLIDVVSNVSRFLPPDNDILNQFIKKHSAATLFYQLGLKSDDFEIVFRSGIDSSDEVDSVYQYLKNKNISSIMIDVGAHTGGALRKFAQAGWQVFAFEPDRKNREALINNFKNVRNVIIDKRAVSDKEQFGVKFYSSNVSTGISGLIPFHESHQQSDIVDITTLNSFCEQNNISEVDFLKIDTEGNDLFVLKGFPFEKISPRVVVCEFEDLKTVKVGYNYIEMADYLVSRGYTVLVSEWYPIVRYGIKHSWRELKLYPCKLYDYKAWGNFIAFKLKNDLKDYLKANNFIS